MIAAASWIVGSMIHNAAGIGRIADHDAAGIVGPPTMGIGRSMVHDAAMIVRIAIHDAAGVGRSMIHDAAGIARSMIHDAAGIGRSMIHRAWVGQGTTPAMPGMGRRGILPPT
jgi:hypothetical protein